LRLPSHRSDRETIGFGNACGGPGFLGHGFAVIDRDQGEGGYDRRFQEGDYGGPDRRPGTWQRWSAAHKREVVLRMLRGEPLEALSRQLGIESYRLEKWREKALSGIDAALKERESDPVQAELSAAMRRIGELTMQNELLWQRVRKPGPLAKRRSPK